MQDFLNLYFDACKVLKTEQDFYDLMYAYLRRASVDNVFVAEIFFDPQSHTDRGIPFDVVINGLYGATIDGYHDFGIRANLILCFLRDLSEAAAIQTLEEAKPHLEKIIGIGLDSAEVGNPPSKFEHVYRMAAGLGLKLVAHAGEEAGPSYIQEALDVLGVQRIDHGVLCLKDSDTVQRLVRTGVPLTTCPLSNQKLQVLSRHFDGRDVTKELLTKGVMVTVNSDDPAYFGGYITDNFLLAATASRLNERDVCQICRNAFKATFLPELDKQSYLQKIEKFNVAMGCAAPPKSVTFFGSRSPSLGSKEYDGCMHTAKLLASKGFAVVNGGYGGLMEAASRGSSEGTKYPENGSLPALSVGVLAPCVFRGRPSHGNSFLSKSVLARSLPERAQRLMDASEYFYVCEGTFGTLTELLSTWNVACIRPLFGGIPPKIYVLGSYWEKTLEVLMSSINMCTEDREMVKCVESGEEMVRMVEEDWKKRNANAIL